MKAFTTARLGSNMELRYMPDGTPVGSVSLAIRLGIKDKESGEYKTQWIHAALFGKRAESLAPYLVKGSLHAFHLRDIHIDEFVGKDGEKRTSLKATIDDVELCGKHAAQQDEGSQSPAQDRQPGAPASPAKTGSFDNFDDDVPFMRHGHRGAGVCWRAM